ncbi:hypothetical protein [Bradyrhizobium sp. BR 1432]|uniref:hypothetical protein n=1 Tax=Bradyrhizobium sp. BR 1432 TaxID=3447966 RepID=UPI003EE4749B
MSIQVRFGIAIEPNRRFGLIVQRAQPDASKRHEYRTKGSEDRSTGTMAFRYLHDEHLIVAFTTSNVLRTNGMWLASLRPEWSLSARS